MDNAALLMTLGVLSLASIAIDAFGRRTKWPRVSLLILLGVLAGPSVGDLLPPRIIEHSHIVTNFALVMVAFLLGGELSFTRLRREGRAIVIVSLTVVLVTVVIVALGLVAAGVPLLVALLLAGIATATDPAAAQDVIREVGAHSRFARTVLGIVAIDDGWGIIVFGVLLGAASLLDGGDGLAAVLHAAREVGGAVLLGVAVGLPAAFLSGRLRPGEPTLSEALGIVFLCGGLALWLEVSFLLAPMVAGAVVANLARHHTRPFRAIEHIEWPFLVLFFVLAGASLDLGLIAVGGIAFALYVVLRTAARLIGGWLGGALAGLPTRERKAMGLALMPQAGVALGMALTAGAAYPDIAETLLAVTIGSTVVFEVLGPLLTRYALKLAGGHR